MPDNTIPTEVKAPIKTLTLDDVLATPPSDELEKAQKQSEFLLNQKTSAPKIGTSVQGNFEDIQKLVDQNVNFVTPSSTWKQQAATNQSTLEQLGNLANQVVIGHGVGGTIAGFGYIGTLAQGAAEANKYDNLYTNSWVEFGNAILENSQKNNEILKKNPGEFDFGDPASYIQSAADMGSMLSMLIPTGAVVKGLGAVAKGITLSSRFVKATNSIGVGAKFANLATKGITSAIISRQIESSMEAYGKYNETYNKYKSLGLSEEQAKESAAKVAATTYRGNWVMLAQDIPQYLTMYSNLGGSVTKGLGSGFNKALQGAKAFALDSLGEGAEEGYQYLLGEYASSSEDIRSGLANADYGLSYRVKKDLKNDEFLSSVISGMFGSAIIQGGSKALGAYQSKFTESGKEESALTEKYESDKIDLAKNYATKFARINTAIKTSEESGDIDAATYHRKELNTQLALKSSELGNIDKHIEFLEGLQNEDLEEYNTQNGTKYTDDFKKFLPEMIADSKKIGSLVEEGARKYGPSLSTLYAEAKFNLENKDIKRRALDGDIATTVSSLPLLSNFSIPGQIEASNKLLINSNNALLKNLNLLKESDLTESKRKNVESTIKNIEEQNTKLEKEISDSTVLERTSSEKKSDAELLKSIENLPNDLNNKVSHRTILDLDVKNSLDTLNALNKNPNKIIENQLLQKINSTNTIEGLQALSSSLPIEEYDVAKDILRSKLDSKYAELKQIEDDKKRELLKSEILNTDKSGQGKTDTIVGEKQLTLDDILGTNPIEVTETTTAQLDADVFKVDSLSDSEHTDLLFKQGKVVNSGTLSNGDAVSIELEKYDLIVYGIYNNKAIEPKFVFTTGNREYAINNNSVWTIDGEIVSPIQITGILDIINQDINTNSIYETQLFTPKQNEQILQSVIPNQSVISSELSEEPIVGEIIEQVAYTEDHNTEVSAYYDEQVRENLTGTRLAYTNNADTEQNKDLLDLLQSPIPFVDKIVDSFTLSVDTQSEFLKPEQLTDLDKNVENIPIMVSFKGKNGKSYKSYLYTTNTLSAQGYNSEKQIDNLLALRQAVIAAYKQGSSVITQLDESNSVLGGKLVKENKLPYYGRVTDLLEVSAEEISLRTTTKNYYIKPDGKEDYDLGVPRLAGTVHAIIKDNNGKGIPIQLKNNNITPDVAKSIHAIYLAISKSGRKTKISKEFKESFTDPITKSILDILGTESTYNDLLSNLVYEGKRETENKNTPLFLSDNVLTYGSTKIDIDKVNITDFLDYLQTNKFFQINRSLIGNTEYKELLFDNNILTTNLKANGSLFKQPVISLSVEAAKPRTGIKVQEDPLPKKKEDETKPTTTRRGLSTIVKEFDSISVAPSVAKAINEQEAITWLKKNLSKVDVSIQDDVIEVFKNGTQSIGRFTEGMIKLSRLAQSGTEYHEAFHAVSQLYLKPKQRESLYNTVRKVEGKELTDIQAEELLADEFEYYVKTNGLVSYKYVKSVNSEPLSFFGKLLQLIKSIFSDQVSVDKIFKNITSGYYSNKELPTDLQVTSYDKRIDNLSVEQTADITNFLTYTAFAAQDLTFSNIANLDFNKAGYDLLARYDNLDDSFRERYERVFDSLFRKDWRTIYNTVDVDQLSSVEWINYNSTLFENLKDNLRTLGIETKITQVEREELEDEESKEENYSPLVTKASYNYSNKETSRNSTKLLVANLPALEGYKDGKPIYIKDEFFGLPKIADFASSWSFVEDLLSDIIAEDNDGLEIMMDRLSKSLVYKPELTKLYTNLVNGNDTVRTQFYTDMNLVKNNFATTFITKEWNNDKKQYEYTWKFSKGNSKNIGDRIIQDWATTITNNFKSDTKIDQVKLIEQINKLSEIELKVKDNNTTEEELKSTIADLNKVLSDIGIKFNSINSFNYAVSAQPGKDLRSKLRSLLTSTDFGIDAVIERLVQGKDSVSKILNSEKGLLFLALQESKFRKDGFESSITGAEGNKKWTYSYGSFFNKAVSAMKDPKSTLFTKLSNTSYFKNSVWARQVRTGEISAASIEASIFSSLKVEAVGDQGSSLTDLTKNEELSDIINRIIQNIDNNKNRSLFSTGLAKADKSTDVLISGFKAIRSDYTGKELGKGATSILRGYIIDELNRINRANQDVNNWKESNNSSDLIEYYHYDPKNKDIFDKSGGAFRIFLFPGLSPNKLKETNKELYDTLYDESGVAYPILENIKSNSLLDVYINTEFRKILKFEIEQGLKVGVIKGTDEGLKNISLDKEVVKGRSENENDAVISLFADYLLNGIINNVETTKFLHGDPAMYKGGASNPFGDIKKRTPLILASGRQLRIFKDLEGNYVVRPKYTSAVVEDSTVASYTYTEEYIKQLAGIYSEIDNVPYDEVYARLTEQFGAYKKVDETDAQAYITIDRFRETQLGWGKWTDAQEEAYNSIKEWQKNPTQDNLLTARKLSINSELAMQSLKSVHTGLEFYDSNPDTAIVEYNKQSEAVLNPIFTAGLPLDRIRKAMEDQGVDHIIFRSGKKVGTQGPTTISTNGEIHTDIKFNKIKSLSNSNYYLQQDLPVHGFDESLEGSQIYKVVQTNVNLSHKYNNGQTGQELITELNSVQSQLSDIGISSLKSELGYTEKGWTEKALLKLRKKVSDALTKRGASENTRESLQDSSYPFSAIVQAAKKVSNNFNSMVNTAGVKLKMPGGPLIQISGFGIARPTDYTTLDNNTKGGIVWFGDKKLTPPQLIKNEDGTKFIKGQILVPHNIVKNIPGWETMDRKQLIASIDTSILTAIGYRIPNQGPSSNDVLEIVGILPEEQGDSVVLYNEVTTKTGADFDIDKMYIMVPNYTYNEKTGKLEKVNYDKENPTKEGLQNRKLELYEALLSDTASYLSVVAPLDSTFISDTVNELHGVDQIEQQDLMFMSPGYQYQVKTSFRGGKTGIGVLANNIVDHTQAQIYNLKLNGIKYGRGNYTEQGETSLAGVYSEPTKDGKVYKISEVLSWYANAFVDIAKDPYITKGNINDITLSTTMLLTRAGFAPDWVIAFMGQPILKDYVNLMYSNEGRVKNFNDVFLTLSDKYPGFGIADDKVSTSKLEELIKNNDVDSQASILQLFLRYDRTAKALQEQIRATKQDVNGAGKSNIEAFTISELRAKVLKENKIGNVDAKFRGTSLETAYNNSIVTLNDMFGEFLFADNSVTKDVIKQISKNKGLQYATNLDLNEKASTEFYSYVASGLPFFAETNLKELLYGNTSIAKRIDLWKFNPASPVRDNILVQYLEIGDTSPGEPGVVGINQFRDKSIMVQDQISQAWEELLASDNANIKKTAEDLVRYAFYSSGFNPNAKAIFEYIPYKFMKQIGFGEYMDNFMKNPNESIIDNFIDQFYQNNTENDSIVNSVRSLVNKKDGTYTFTEEELEKNIIGYSISNGSTQTEYPRYISRNKEIYKLQGYDDLNTPIYTKLLPKGTKTSTGYSIVEYSFEGNKDSLFVTPTEIKNNNKIKLINLSSPKNPTTEFIDTVAKEEELVFIDNTNPDKVVEIESIVEETEEKDVSLDEPIDLENNKFCEGIE